MQVSTTVIHLHFSVISTILYSPPKINYKSPHFHTSTTLGLIHHTIFLLLRSTTSLHHCYTSTTLRHLHHITLLLVRLTTSLHHCLTSIPLRYLHHTTLLLRSTTYIYHCHTSTTSAIYTILLFSQ